MRYTYEQLEKFEDALAQFYKDKEETIQKIHEDKKAIQNLKTEILNSLLENCHYIRDNQKIIISAPEIIIGNVDKHGVLLNEAHSSITIKANKINNDGISANGDTPGKIVTRATVIENLAVNPGIDGKENTIEEKSRIAAKAKGIGLEALLNRASFAGTHKVTSGIELRTNTHIIMDTIESIQSQIDILDKKKKKLQELLDQKLLEIEEKETKIKKEKIGDNLNPLEEDDEITIITNPLTNSKNALNESYKYDEKLTGHHLNIRLKRDKIDKQRKLFDSDASQHYLQELAYFDNISGYAEMIKEIEDIDKELDRLNQEKDKKDATPHHTFISIDSEKISLDTKNSKGQINTDDAGKVSIHTKDFRVDARDTGKKVIEGSKILLAGERVKVDTSSHDDNHENKTVDGSFYVISNDMTFESVNHKLTKKNENGRESYKRDKETGTTGKFCVRVKNINLSTTDENNKPTDGGDCRINAQHIYLSGVEQEDKDGKLQDKNIDGSSVIFLRSKKVEIGHGDILKETDFIPNQITLKATNGISLQTKEESIEILNKDKDTACLQLTKDGTMSSGGKFSITGTELHVDKTASLGSVTAKEITADNINAQSGIDGPNLSAKGGTGGTAKPKVLKYQKLKEEEVTPVIIVDPITTDPEDNGKEDKK